MDYESLTTRRKNDRFLPVNDLILLIILFRGSMTVLDQGSLKVFLARVVPLTTLPLSLLMILAPPQQFFPGRVCADLGFLPQGMVFL